jgi:signal transduction histidine kinase
MMEENGINPIEQLSQLTGGLAHEIRNPLSTLKVNLQLLAEDVNELGQSDDDRVRRCSLRIRRMQDEVNRLRDILDDFLRFVAHHQLNIRNINLNDTVSQLVEFYEPQAAENNIRVLKQFLPDGLFVNIDTDLFKQGLLNIFINAQQAMPEGGELIIRTSQVNGNAKIEITDTGSGIDPQNLSSIFDAYFSTKKGGMGLGLSMTRRIIEEHKGTISVHSELGKGTSFTIALPLSVAVKSEQSSQ